MTARILWLLAVLLAGYIGGYTVAGIHAYEAEIAANRARVEVARLRYQAQTLNHHLRQQGRAMGYLLITAGWMADRTNPRPPAPTYHAGSK